jgi:hypothetical protein
MIHRRKHRALHPPAQCPSTLPRLADPFPFLSLHSIRRFHMIAGIHVLLSLSSQAILATTLLYRARIFLPPAIAKSSPLRWLSGIPSRTTLCARCQSLCIWRKSRRSLGGLLCLVFAVLSCVLMSDCGRWRGDAGKSCSLSFQFCERKGVVALV